MRVDSALLAQHLEDAEAAARRIEALGYDGAYTFEGPHDPFFPLVLAARATREIRLATAIAVAFARNPMLLAHIGWDLQAFSGGRFVLGLGSQIRPHVERRFGMPWSRPAARMRELVLAVRAIWDCWSGRRPLDFRGEFYTHTLMTPVFAPGKNPHGDPPIFLAGVGPGMTEVAGEVADGFLAHPFNTPESVREITLPALQRGLARGGRRLEDFEISHSLLIVSGRDPRERELAERVVRGQIAFYASTPAYRPVLESRGWEAVHPELNALSKRGQWEEMARLVSDEMLEAVAVAAPLPELASRVRARCGDFARRVSLVAPWALDPEVLAGVAGELRGPAPAAG